MPRWIFALVQFLPLSLFATYAFWDGAPNDLRWQHAFQLASVAALVQLAIVLPQRRPASRLVLAANLYLLLGGLAFFAQQWWFLELYDALRESAIFIIMLGVGVATTVGSRAGFVAACSLPRAPVVRASLWLLAATALSLVVSMIYRGDQYLAAVYPIIALAVIHRVLLYRLARQHGAAANNSSKPAPLRGAASLERWPHRRVRSMVIYRIPGTTLVLCGVLLTIKFGFQALSTLNDGCRSTLPVGACQAIRLLLSSLLVSFSIYFFMLLANRLWGRNLFKARPS